MDAKHEDVKRLRCKQGNIQHTNDGQIPSRRIAIAFIHMPAKRHVMHTRKRRKSM